MISEQKVLKFAEENLTVTLENSDIERAHRIVTYQEEKNRPIITCFSSFKTKSQLLQNGSHLKGSLFSISEDFCENTRIARHDLVTFAKRQSFPFKLLHIGPKTFIYDAKTETVKEILRKRDAGSAFTNTAGSQSLIMQTHVA